MGKLYLNVNIMLILKVFVDFFCQTIRDRDFIYFIKMYTKPTKLSTKKQPLFVAENTFLI